MVSGVPALLGLLIRVIARCQGFLRYWDYYQGFSVIRVIDHGYCALPRGSCVIGIIIRSSTSLGLVITVISDIRCSC